MKLFRQGAAARDHNGGRQNDPSLSTPAAGEAGPDYGDRFAWRFDDDLPIGPAAEPEPEAEDPEETFVRRPRGGDRFAAAEQPFQSAPPARHDEMSGLRRSLTAPDAAPPAPAPQPAVAAEPDLAEFALDMPTPLTGRGDRRGARVKTRLLGFNHQNGGQTDPFSAEPQAQDSADPRFPVGWLVVMKGPGRGACFTLFNGVSQIGRGEDQAVRLDFGDDTISRSNHALIAYDAEHRKFYLGHGGKVNIVRLNDRPVLSTEEISGNDSIRIGETTLRFVAFCGSDFDWAEGSAEPSDDHALV